MTPIIGAIGVAIVTVVLFRFDRPGARLSKALWVPFAWLLIASSRPISAWIYLGVAGNTTNEYIDRSPLDRNILTFLLILGLLALATRSRQVPGIIAANPVIILFFLYCLISLLWADYPFVAFKRWIRGVGDVVMVLVIITRTPLAGRAQVDLLANCLSPHSVVDCVHPVLPFARTILFQGGTPEWTASAPTRTPWV